MGIIGPATKFLWLAVNIDNDFIKRFRSIPRFRHPRACQKISNPKAIRAMNHESNFYDYPWMVMVLYQTVSFDTLIQTSISISEKGRVTQKRFEPWIMKAICMISLEWRWCYIRRFRSIPWFRHPKASQRGVQELKSDPSHESWNHWILHRPRDPQGSENSTTMLCVKRYYFCKKISKVVVS